MRYVTIYNAVQQNRIIALKLLLQEHNFNFRVINEPANAAVPVGTKVQVHENQVGQAMELLKKNGFLGNPEPEPKSGEITQFWMFLLVALVLIIIFSILINTSLL